MKLRVLFTAMLLSLACSADPAQHPSGAYRFELPAGWTQQEPELWQDKTHHRVLNTVKVDGLAEEKLEAWAQITAQDGAKKKWTDIKVSDATLGGNKAKIVTALENSQAKPVFIKIYLAIHNATGGSLIFIDEDGDSPELEANVTSIVDSFQWK